MYNTNNITISKITIIKKLAKSLLLFLLLSTSFSLFASAEQYVEAYNELINGINLRLEPVYDFELKSIDFMPSTDTPVYVMNHPNQRGVEVYNYKVAKANMQGNSFYKKKFLGDSVFQSELDSIRVKVIELGSNYYLLNDNIIDSDNIETNDISTLFIKAIHNDSEKESIMDGIGENRIFTAVPKEYTSKNKIITSNNFIHDQYDIPLLSIHFRELAQVISKLKYFTTTSITYVEKKNRFVKYYTSGRMVKSNGGRYVVRDYYFDVSDDPYIAPVPQSRWSEPFYDEVLEKCKSKWNLSSWINGGSNTPNSRIIYSVVNHRWVGATTTVYADKTKAKASINITSNLSSGKFHFISLTQNTASEDPLSKRSYGTVGIEKNDTNITSNSLFMANDSPPSGIPPESPTYGSPESYSESIVSIIFIGSGNFPTVHFFNPVSTGDEVQDGLLVVGCDCTTCKPGSEEEFHAYEDCPRVKHPLGVSTGSNLLHVRAYMTDYSANGRPLQAYSLDTGVINNASGYEADSESPNDLTKRNYYKFALVKRPKGAEILFCIQKEATKFNKPDNALSYKLYVDYELDANGDEILDSNNNPIPTGLMRLEFPENDICHYFSGSSVVKVSMKMKGTEKPVVLTGHGTQWSNLKTHYETVFDNKKRIKVVTGYSIYSWPLYPENSNLMSHIEYREKMGSHDNPEKGPILWESKVEQVTDSDTGVTTTIITNYTGSTNTITSITQIINDPENNETRTLKIDPATSTTLTERIRKETINDLGQRIITDTIISNGSSSVSSVLIQDFTWGSEIVKSIDALGTNDEISSENIFYNDAENDGGAYSNLKSTIEKSGDITTSWTRYKYDQKGRLTQLVAPFNNADSNAEEEICRTTEYSYIPVDSGDEPTKNDMRARTIIEKVLGTEVSRSYNIYLPTQTKSISAFSASAAWDTTDNLITTTEAYITDDFRNGRTKKITRPNGTIIVYTYLQAGDGITTTIESGVGVGETVTNGTRSVTITDAKGNTSNSETFDIASRIKLSSTSFLLDVLGRPTRVDYMNGTHTETIYGCCGPKTQINREGTQTTTAYNALKQLSYTSTNGITNLYSYDLFGNTISTTRKGSDGSEITTSNSYNNAGEQISSTDPMGNVTTYSNDTFSSTTTYPDGTTTISITNMDGSTVSTSGTAIHGMTSEYGIENGELFTKSYPTATPTQWTKSFTDFLGRNYKTVYADNSASTVYYDSASRVIKSVSPSGITTLTVYNAKGEVSMSAIDMNQNGSIDLDGSDSVTQYSNSVTQNHGTNVRKSTTSVNINGVMIETSLNETDVFGLQSWQTSFDKTAHTIITYSGEGQRTTVSTAPDSSTVTQNYTNGLLQSSTHSVLGVTNYTYDPHNRTKSVSHTVNGAPQTTTYAYNNNNQTTQVTDNASLVTGFLYDNMSRKTTLVLPDGRQVNYEYSSTGELTKESGADIYPRTYSYNDTGKQSALNTFKDYPNTPQPTQWSYDNQRGFMISKTYADNKTDDFTYTTDGQMATKTSPKNITTTYGYDTAGRVISNSYSDTTAGITLTLDNSGKTIGVTDGIGTHTITYNNDGTVSSSSLANVANHKLTHSYDSLGRSASMQILNNTTPLLTHTREYDGASRLASVSNGSISANYARISGSNLLDSTTINNGLSDILVVDRSYDSLNRLTKIRNTIAGTDISTFYYEYNDVDKITKCTLIDESYWLYEYDNFGQITSAKKFAANATPVNGKQFTYTYDTIGNRLTASSDSNVSNYTSNILNQYLARTIPGIIEILGTASIDAIVKIHRKSLGETASAILDPDRNGETFSKTITVDNTSSAVTEEIDVYCYKTSENEEITEKESRTVNILKSPENFVYDDAGNLISDGRLNYTWNGENRMISAEEPEKMKVMFEIDYMGRRTSRKLYNWNGTSWIQDETRKFIWNGYNKTAILDEHNVLQKSMTWGEDLSGTLQGLGGVGGLLSVKDHITGRNYIPLYNGNGNVMVYIDSVNGTKVASFEYKPNGGLLYKNDPLNLAEVASFSTKPYDKDLDAILYELRILKDGRWLSRDSLGENGGLNLYGGNHNDFINNIDYLGLKIIACRDIDEFIRKHKVKGWGYNNYGQGAFTDAGIRYNKSSIVSEIIAMMIKSDHSFKVKGSSKEEQIRNLKKHIKTRLKIIKNAKAKRYKFGAGSAFSEHHTNPGIDIASDPQAYFESINNSTTKIACQWATMLVFYGGIGTWRSGDDSRNIADKVWIPGDWGYINNAAQDRNSSNWADGLEGENLIYLGKGKYWGHITTDQTIYSLKGWMDYIKTWKGRDRVEKGDPVLDGDVNFPMNGLE